MQNEKCKMAKGWCLAALMTVVLLLPFSCREQAENSSDQSGKDSTPPPAATESADQFAARAAASMTRRDFAKAGELYQRATTAPESGDRPWRISERVDWQCKATLAWWLAGDWDQTNRAADSKVTWVSPPCSPDLLTEYESLRALRTAMSVYRNEGWPVHDPDRMLDVLLMAPAVQLHLGDEGSDVRGGPETSCDLIWEQVLRLPELLAVVTVLDTGRLDLLRNLQVVALLKTDLKAATTRPEDQPVAQPDNVRTFKYVLFAGRLDHPAPARGDNCQPIREWLTQLAAGQSTMSGGETWNRIDIGVRCGGEVLNVWWLNVRKEPTGQISCRFVTPTWLRFPAVNLKKFSAALRVLASATPEGATPVATRGQGEMVLAALARLTGRPGLARIQPQDNYFWVMPIAASKPADSSLIPLVAGWLAYHDWKLPSSPPATSQPAGSQPDETTDVTTPADPTEP